MTSHRVNNGFWTLETLHTEAKKYNTRNEFKTKSPKAYDAALVRKIMNIICSHMEWKSTKPKPQ